MPAERSNLDAVGAAIASLRELIGWTQERLGGKAGVTQGWVSKVESGCVADLTFASAERLVEAMGARLAITVDAPYLADRRRQREPAHARMSAHLTTRLRRDGWEVATEVEVGGGRSRGWIDVLAFDPRTGILLVIELKTEIHDLGAIQRSLSWYEREAWRAARLRGWRPTRVVGCLLLLATEANDARVAANREVFANEFPCRARDITAIVGGMSPTGRSGRVVAMVDPRSRRSVWIRPLRVDGRRTAAPYVDYADFQRAVGRGRSTSR